MFGLRERTDIKTQIVFVRHGESFGNISADVPEGYSSDDPPLTDKGIQMAEKLADCFEKEAIAGIFASPLVRAVQTASPIAEKLGMDMNILPELAEKDTYCSEDALTLRKRAKKCIDIITEKYKNGETVIVVTHGTFLSFLARESLCMNDCDSFNFEADNCSVTIVVLRDAPEKPLLRTVNNTNF